MAAGNVSHRGPRRSRVAATALWVLVLILALAGCDVHTVVSIEVAEDGSGTVTVGVGFDEEAMERRPDLFDELAVDDLVEAGWEVSGPAVEDDGRTWLRLRKPFTRTEQVRSIVAEIAGDDGPLRDVGLTRSDRFADTRYDFSGTLDASADSGGVATVLDDAEMTEVLGAEASTLVETRADAPLEETVREMRVEVRLPGEVRSNGSGTAGPLRSWTVSPLEAQVEDMSATGTLSRPERYAWTALSVVAALAAVAFAVRRYRHRGARVH